MQLSIIVNDLLLSLFIFCLVVAAFSFLFHAPRKSGDRPLKSELSVIRGEYTPLACLWEDAPSSALKGQFYPLATPLMSSIACLWEDAPSSALKGQFYSWATSLMTPFACVVTRTWHDFYRQNLRKIGVNYWHWRDKPEANRFFPELSWLLALPLPDKYTGQVLNSLLARKLEQKYFWLPSSMKLAWEGWHDQACNLIGIDALQRVYQVCYGTNWETIELLRGNTNYAHYGTVIHECSPWWQVLDVHPTANSLQVEKAYKILMRRWHPDLNTHPHANQISSVINLAYEHYQENIAKPQNTEEIDVNSDKSSNTAIFNLVMNWLKLLLSS